jgi:hypothetical protein
MKPICVANNSQPVVHERPGATWLLHVVKPADAAAVVATSNNLGKVNVSM